MILFRIFLLILSLLLMSGPMAPQSVAEERKAPKIIFYAKDYWEAWTRERLPSLDAINPPLTINGKSYDSCAKLAQDQEGEPMTYQLKIENPRFPCVYITVFGNIQRPKSALFPTNKIATDVFNNLDAKTLPWPIDLTDKNKNTIESISGIEKIQINNNSISFNIEPDWYHISVISASDNIGDGTQQLLVSLMRNLNDSNINFLKHEETYFLLTRDVPGGPIRAQPARFRPVAYASPPKELQSQAIVFDARYRDYRNGWTP